MSENESHSLFDKILGKEQLRERIEELQSEVDELESDNGDLEETIEKLRKKKSKEVTEKQRAYEQKNRLQDKVEELHDKVEKLPTPKDNVSENETEMTLDLNPSEVREVTAFLNDVEYQRDSAIVAHITENGIPEEVNEFVKDRGRLIEHAPCTLFADRYGLVCSCLEPIEPHPSKPVLSDNFSFQPEYFTPADKKSLFILIRSDIFAIGESHESGEIEHLKGFTSNVKSSHSKGGFSQSRFERLREEQIESHVKKSREQIDRFYAEDIDRVIVTGQREIIDNVSDYADFMGYTDASGSPQDALKDSYHKFWSSRLYNI